MAAFRGVAASRAALALHKGEPLFRRSMVCHTCDNPICCNPAHLFEGTGRDNLLDAVTKGRTKTKITDDQVRAIRGTKSKQQAQALADQYGISLGHANSIKARRFRASVPD